MQEQKTYNLSDLQIAGLLFAKPSIPASVAFHLIFKDLYKGSKTVLSVSQRPAFARTVTREVTLLESTQNPRVFTSMFS